MDSTGSTVRTLGMLVQLEFIRVVVYQVVSVKALELLLRHIDSPAGSASSGRLHRQCFCWLLLLDLCSSFALFWY
jgi:hypothetical protein